MKISQICDRVLCAAFRSTPLRFALSKLFLKNIDNQVGETPIFFPASAYSLSFRERSILKEIVVSFIIDFNITTLQQWFATKRQPRFDP